MCMLGFLLLLLALVSPLPSPTPSWAAVSYEESLKQLAEGVTEKAVKAKKQRLALVNFTDAKGEETPLGQFLTEELGTQIMVAGELTVVDRTLLSSTLKKMQIAHLDPSHAKTVRRAAKAIRTDLFITGTYIETPEGLQLTVRLINPVTAQPIGATRASVPKAGPMTTFFKKEEPPPEKAQLNQPKEPPPPVGLGTHRNEYYELVVTALERQGDRVKVDFTVQNHSTRDLKLICHLQDTFLTDEQGTVWPQRVEENREGLCTRGLELFPHRKQRAVFTFTSPAEASASQLTLHVHEQSPRRDASFTINGLTLGSPPAPKETMP